MELSDFPNALNWNLTAVEVGLVDSAQANAWYDDADTHLTDSTTPTINDLNAWEPAYSQAIEVGSWEGSSFTVTCAERAGSDDCSSTLSPPTGGARAFAGGPASVNAGEEAGRPAALDAEFRPISFALLPPRPNPTRGTVELWFDVPWEGRTVVEIEVYNVAGRRVRGVLDAPVPLGRHFVSWDLRNEDGGRVSPGIYFARIVARGDARTQRITVLK